MQRAVPDERLRQFVRCYVQREAYTGGDELVEPVVARLCSILEFQFAGPYDVPIYGIDQPNPSKPITVIGPITSRQARIVICGHVQALAVIFQPLGLHAMFQVPVASFSDIGTEGHSLLGKSVSSLFEKLGNAESFQKRAEFLDRFFLERLHIIPQRTRVNLALKRLTSPVSRMPIAHIARRAGISDRQLERIALQQLGMSPQTVQRIARFERALRLKIESGHSWTEIAYAAEYCDQMHMVREFRAFAGNPPGDAFGQMTSTDISRQAL